MRTDVRIELDGLLIIGTSLEQSQFDLLFLNTIYLYLTGSDTGIRTRVSAVRGRRPGPLDDIASEERVQRKDAPDPQFIIFACPGCTCNLAVPAIGGAGLHSL